MKKATQIKYKDFTLVSCGDVCPDRFNLHRIVENPKTHREFHKHLGYGYSFEEGLAKIIRISLSDRNDITDIKSYVNEFKKSVAELNKIIK